MLDLVVASFNIRNGLAFDGWNSWLLRRRSTARTIRGLGADVVGLQEVYGFQQRYLERSLRTHRGYGEGRDLRQQGERCPVLVRDARLDVVTSRTRWYGGTDDEVGITLPDARFPRIATSAVLRDRDCGTEFEVLNTHLDERRPENRTRSIEQLLTWVVDTRPTVIVGDLNATEADPMFELLRTAGFRSALPAKSAGTVHGFTGRTDRRRIDHIVVSREWEVVDGSVVTDNPGRRLPSDHWPVVACLRLAGS